MGIQYNPMAKKARAYIDGEDWKDYKVTDCFPDDLTDEVETMLLDLIIDKFQEMCTDAGYPSVRWLAQTGKATFDVRVYRSGRASLGGDVFLDVLRDQAIEMVSAPLFGRVMNDGKESPLQEKVEAIMFYLPPDEYAYLEDI